MVKLIERSALSDMLPVQLGSCALDEIQPGELISVAPAAGKERTVAEALKKRFGLGFPGPNRSLAKGAARIIWFGPGQAMLGGVRISRLAGAALVDQSDGWAVMRLSGAGAEAVLARLVPVDLRAAHFKRGHTARTMLGHMPVSITRIGASGFQIMVFRSMAATAVHDLSRAMAGIAALAGVAPA